MRKSAFTTSAAFHALQSHFAQAKGWHMRDLFSKDGERFHHFSIDAAGLLFDYSKNRIDSTTMKLLVALAQEQGVEQMRNAMFSGEKINTTEHRAVLHTALRAPGHHTLTLDGQDVIKEVHRVLAHIKSFTERVRSGAWLGCAGQPITDVVNIGIGGSDLGPEMVCHALRSFTHPRLSMHFVSNVDAHDLDAILPKVNPETTLFVVASKTFTTRETMMNAQSARNWFLRTRQVADLPKHFVAVSTNTEAVKEFGIDIENMFPFWDWVGGRYSVWSAIGLSVALAIGFENFSEFLAGAYRMDQHFQEAPLAQNMPVIMGLIGLWNRNFFGNGSISIAPYHQDLNQFPAYLQQLEMESNGKRVTLDGSPVDTATCPIIWGNVGTNGQHAYFQLMHQGTDVTPVDFIVALKPSHAFSEHQPVLLANCFAQSEAFMKGKSADEVRTEMKAQNLPENEIEALIPHRVFPGNRPSNTILMESLTPATLGALIALYEHKVFVQGVLWGINSFDQWGVEFGKVLAKQIETEMAADGLPNNHDSSTNALIARAKASLRR